MKDNFTSELCFKNFSIFSEILPDAKIDGDLSQEETF